MKRVLSLFLSCIFVLGVCFSTPVIASATEPETFEVDGNVFQYEENNECSIEKWNGSDVALTLTTVQDENEITYTITGILSGVIFLNVFMIEFASSCGTVIKISFQCLKPNSKQ